MTFEPKDSLIIDIEEFISIFHIAPFKDYLIYYREPHRFEFYDVNTGKREKTIVFSDLSSQLPSVSGFHIQSEDSIFVLQKNSNWLYLIDKNGSLLNKYDLSFDLSEQMPFEHKEWGIPQYLSGTLYFDMAANSDYTWEQVYSSPRILGYKYLDSDTNTNHFVFGKYPQKFLETSYGAFASIYSKTTNNKNQLVVLYDFMDSIYVYNQSGELVKRKQIRSKYYKEPGTFPMEKLYDRSFSNEYDTKTAFYVRCVYDRYRKLYYLSYKHAVKKETDEEGLLITSRDTPWSLLVLDENFELIDEIYFPAKTHIFVDIYPVKEGLLIDSNHPLSKDYKPNKKVYTLYEVKVNK